MVVTAGECLVRSRQIPLSYPTMMHITSESSKIAICVIDFKSLYDLVVKDTFVDSDVIMQFSYRNVKSNTLCPTC